VSEACLQVGPRTRTRIKNARMNAQTHLYMHAHAGKLHENHETLRSRLYKYTNTNEAWLGPRWVLQSCV